MANKLIVAPAPHVHGSESTQKIMRDVLLALTPALVFSVVAFGWSALAVTCISVASCVLFEYLIQKFLLKGPCTVSDLSAVVTGVLLAFNLPASLPWWIVVIGAFVSIAIAKMTFGGLGKNPFNPALVGRVFLLFAYPVQMTTFPRPVGQLADAFSGATPLAAVKAELVSHTSVNYQDVLFGSIPGSLGEVSALLLLVGAVYLLWRKVITWHIPVAVLGTMAVFVFLVGLGQGMHGEALWEFPLFHLLAGGAILGAVYMATDYSTSPMTHTGMLIYGVGIGIITVLIRLWGAYPEGMSFAILIMNSVVPLINKYVKPRSFRLFEHPDIEDLTIRGKTDHQPDHPTEPVFSHRFYGITHHTASLGSRMDRHRQVLDGQCRILRFVELGQHLFERLAGRLDPCLGNRLLGNHMDRSHACGSEQCDHEQHHNHIE